MKYGRGKFPYECHVWLPEGRGDNPEATCRAGMLKKTEHPTVDVCRKGLRKGLYVRTSQVRLLVAHGHAPNLLFHR